MKKVFVLLGLPGSGKGTQSSILAKKIGLIHIATGEIFRKMSVIDSNDAQLINKYMSQGKMVPNSLVNKVVCSYLHSNECKDGCVLDGYPRNVEQAEYLLNNNDLDVKVILLDISDELVRQRTMGRFSCDGCGQLYNKFLDAPKKNNVCDVCGGYNFSNRSDDNVNLIDKRIAEYKEHTVPLIKYYRDKNKLYSINASNSKAQVSNDLDLIVKNV